MSAKPNDILRIQEIYDIATETLAQLEELSLTEEQFLYPSTARDKLMTEGLVNRVLRAAEEGGKLSTALLEYGFEMKEMSGLRNRIVHAYGTIDMGIIWKILQTEFPQLVENCEDYCTRQGLYLRKTWQDLDSSQG